EDRMTQDAIRSKITRFNPRAGLFTPVFSEAPVVKVESKAPSESCYLTLQTQTDEYLLWLDATGPTIRGRLMPHRSKWKRKEPTSQTGDPLEQLKRLGELRDSGVVSPEEFEAKK